MRALCEKHNLAVGADGKCVVCRRPFGGALGLPQPPPVETLLSKIVTLLLLLGLVAAIGALGYLATLPEPYSGPKRMGGLPPDEDTSLATIKPQVLPAEPEPEPERDAGEAAPVAAAVDEPKATDAPGTKAEEPAAEAPAPPKLDQKARYAARARVPVTLYTSGWCTLCDQARDYLMVRGVAVQSVDIDADKAVYERLLTINKAASLPTFEVGGKPVIGFNPTELETIIDSAAAGTAP